MMFKIISMLFLLLMALNLSARAQSSSSFSSPEMQLIGKLYSKGVQLSEAEVAKLEEQLTANADDLDARILLMSYYSDNNTGENIKGHSKEMVIALQRHIFWFIENHPEHIICDLFISEIRKNLYPEAYAKAREIWVRKTETHRDSAKVQGHAARFFMLSEEDDVAEDLLKRAQALEPQNPEWSNRLSSIYRVFSMIKSPKASKEYTLNSLAEFENALTLATSERDRMFLITKAPRIAFRAGDMKKARGYAITLLGEAPRYENADINFYGTALHEANIALGKVALRLNDVDKAKSYLLKAAEVPESPVMSSFGPNMSLAKDLLEIGEKEVVIKYFQLCAKFWTDGAEDLKTWETDVRENREPDFGGKGFY